MNFCHGYMQLQKKFVIVSSKIGMLYTWFAEKYLKVVKVLSLKHVGIWF